MASGPSSPPMAVPPTIDRLPSPSPPTAIDHSECRMPPAYAPAGAALVGPSLQTTQDLGPPLAPVDYSAPSWRTSANVCYVTLTEKASAHHEHVAGAHRPAEALDLQLADRFDLHQALYDAG